jgi:hypothetical protein
MNTVARDKPIRTVNILVVGGLRQTSPALQEDMGLVNDG